MSSVEINGSDAINLVTLILYLIANWMAIVQRLASGESINLNELVMASRGTLEANVDATLPPPAAPSSEPEQTSN